MIANAPEKLYLFENPITETPDDRWLSKRSGDTDVEYIRKDAFIEKACNYLFSHMGLFATFFDDDIVEDIERSEFIKKFRIAMEGKL